MMRARRLTADVFKAPQIYIIFGKLQRRLGFVFFASFLNYSQFGCYGHYIFAL